MISQQVNGWISILESCCLQILAKVDQVEMILQLFLAEMLLTDSEGAVSYGHFWSFLLGNNSLSCLFRGVLALCMRLQSETVAFGISRIVFMDRVIVELCLNPSETQPFIEVFPHILLHSPCYNYYKHKNTHFPRNIGPPSQFRLAMQLIWQFLVNYYYFNLFQPQMKYLAAYALLSLSGKKDITAQDIKGLLGSVQSHATDDEINQVIAAVKGKAIHQLIGDGQARLGSAPAPAAKVEKKEVPKKEEKKLEPKKEEPKKEEPKKKVVEEPKEDEDADFGDLFG